VSGILFEPVVMTVAEISFARHVLCSTVDLAFVLSHAAVTIRKHDW
jgi:hypothetical protein